MAEPFKLTRIPSLKSVDEFRRHCASLGLQLPCEDQILTGSASPLNEAIPHVTIKGKQIGNRYAIQPMEGWDGTTSGGISDEMLRRWARFGESGAKLIYGGEAMAVRADGRANPNQLILTHENKDGIAQLRHALIAAHKEQCGTAEDLIIGFQLTHSGRFCRPTEKKRLEPRIAFRHPILDRKFGITDDAALLTDDDVQQLITSYVEAAAVAEEIGADFVDLKH